MKTYQVTIKATIIKTYTVDADGEDNAIDIAHDYFTVQIDDAPERYEQETLEITEVNK